MCPLRLILVFLSASLAGYFAWKSIRSDSPKPQDDVSDENEKVLADSEKESGFGKVIGKGFWTFVDMASGRYLWRNLKVGSQEGEKMKGS
ncbi:tRNA adenine57-N1/adenine58-N1-methyltransferase [Cinnamomum micranthum f. kanehirae]|uniref:tRNA adenine57-N1/adenine58-N1-methyltransferase n=1 Tax=Cinnamomum micranthum f. kanehirae TaxID=337451 RepID=A0A3S3N6R2_9MAGN|nr:tRNA adenine57-N1/adenine58-N1-methyltransferase [Cinnamomum micranthum f. kanehirae]